MTHLDTLPAPARPSFGSWVIYALVGGGVGAAASVWLFPAMKVVAWADALMLGMAFCCLMSGLMLGVASFDRRGLALVLRFEGGASRAEAGGVRLSGIVLMLTAALLATPVVAALLDLTLSPSSLWLGLLALFTIQSVFNLWLWLSGDELHRRIVVEAGALCFWLGQAGLFLFAAAERLGLVAPLSAWQTYALVMALYLMASAFVSLRRIGRA